MVIHGHFENGVIVPHGEISLPDGTTVEVSVRALGGASGLAPEARAQREAPARSAALPGENSGDDFSGADHDRVLYGKP